MDGDQLVHRLVLSLNACYMFKAFFLMIQHLLRSSSVPSSCLPAASAGCAFQAVAGTAQCFASRIGLHAARDANAYRKQGSKRTADRKCPRACQHILEVGETSRQQNRMALECFHSVDSC